MTGQDALIDALLRRLREPSPVTSGLIGEDIDEESVPEEVFEAVIVTMASSTSAMPSLLGAPLVWRTELAVTAFARHDGRGTLGLSRASRELQGRVFARVMQDPTLGGAAWNYEEPQISSDTEHRMSRLGACTGIYVFHHQTQPASLEAMS